ncbi:hypothetical protein OROGR_030558 [Orobanche gracilis]
MDGFTVNVPELKLLKQYQNDVSWISRFNNAVENSQQFYDQENVFNELTCIMNDGALLKIQVDELAHVEVAVKKAKCRLNGSKQLELFLEEMDGFTVNVPELKLLKQYQNDVSWISRFNNAVENSQQFYDQENVFNELTCIMNDGALLKIQIDELAHVEVAVKKAKCRLNGSKAGYV